MLERVWRGQDLDVLWTAASSTSKYGGREGSLANGNATLAGWLAATAPTIIIWRWGGRWICVCTNPDAAGDRSL